MFFEIKQDSLKNNKIARYFVYAFGEVIIIIVGVLIAISFNNYNTSTNSNSQAYEYLSDIQDDLLKDNQKLSVSLVTSGEELLLLKNYFFHLDNLDVLPVKTLQNIRDLSISYPYNEREDETYLTINQNIFTNASESMHDMVDRVNQYYHYCRILDHNQTNSLSLYNKAINFWVTSEIDVFCDDKEILIDVLSSSKYKNLLLFKNQLISDDKEYYQHCVNFNAAVSNEIRDFLIKESN